MDFAKQLFVKMEQDGDDIYPVTFDTLQSAADTNSVQVVSIYKLEKVVEVTAKVSTKLSTKLVRKAVK